MVVLMCFVFGASVTFLSWTLSHHMTVDQFEGFVIKVCRKIFCFRGLR